MATCESFIFASSTEHAMHEQQTNSVIAAHKNQQNLFKSEAGTKKNPYLFVIINF